jgi:hypothetical protein
MLGAQRPTAASTCVWLGCSCSFAHVGVHVHARVCSRVLAAPILFWKGRVCMKGGSVSALRVALSTMHMGVTGQGVFA